MSKKQGKKEDTISQLKKEEKIKKNNKKEEDESASEEEEEQNDNDIKEQTIQKSDKPKNLKDLLSSMEQKPKAKPKKPQQKEKKPKNNDEPVKHIFINSKGTANADTKIVPNNENDKKNYTYTEKEVKKAYNEDVAKPTFTSGKDGENFVELNKNEDVSDKIYLII